MNKSKKQFLTFTALNLIILFNLGITGCGSKDYNTKEEKIAKTISSGSSSVIETISSTVPKRDITEKIFEDSNNIDKTISSGYYLSLGTLDENVLINETEQNKSGITVVNKNIIFPQCRIKSISMNSWSRKEKHYNPPKHEIVQYVDALENAEIVDNVPEKVLKKMVKIETHILYLNSHNKFRTISIINFGNGYHEISVAKDNKKNFAKNIPVRTDTGKKYYQIFLHSMKAENIIKKWINWESQGKDGFSSIQNASLSVNGSMDVTEFTEDQLKKLETYLKSDKKLAEAPCGYENYFECIQEDGSKFHFSISADGESISTDKAVYVVDYPDNVEIVELFKEIHKSAKK